MRVHNIQNQVNKMERRWRNEIKIFINSCVQMLCLCVCVCVYKNCGYLTMSLAWYNKPKMSFLFWIKNITHAFFSYIEVFRHTKQCLSFWCLKIFLHFFFLYPFSSWRPPAHKTLSKLIMTNFHKKKKKMFVISFPYEFSCGSVSTKMCVCKYSGE